jgi:hypothetical protein
MQVNNRFTIVRPEKSLSRSDLDAYVERIKRSGKTGAIYCVGQLGYIVVYIVDSDTKLEADEKYKGVLDGYIMNAVLTPSRQSRTKLHYESYNMTTDGSLSPNGAFGPVPHFAFTDEKAADEYSALLRNSPEHIEDVKDWHAHCAEQSSSEDFVDYD